MHLINSLRGTDIIIALIIGGILAGIYHYLLWMTVIHLKKVKKKGLLLFASGIGRIFLLIFTALVFSNDNAGKFLFIILGFLIVRLVILRFFKAKINIRGALK
ncbi:MAG: hypothetical protein LBU87_04075 [Lactobacillales bacterium]|jgi:F1F0 ATPase subunit 2|nr:hypothetical protein [Lactobacillales bacterium]